VLQLGHGLFVLAQVRLNGRDGRVQVGDLALDLLGLLQQLLSLLVFVLVVHIERLGLFEEIKQRFSRGMNNTLGKRGPQKYFLFWKLPGKITLSLYRQSIFMTIKDLLPYLVFNFS
jgi:hypothetical protein